MILDNVSKGSDPVIEAAATFDPVLAAFVPGDNATALEQYRTLP